MASDCIFQILQLTNNYQTCQPTKITVPNTIIQQIDESYYIGIFPKEVKTQTKCETQNIQNLHGSYLFEVPPGCSFQTEEATFINQEAVSPLNSPILLPRIDITHLNWTTPEKEPVLHLEDIDLDSLTDLRNKARSINHLSPKNNYHFHSFNLWNIISYILLTLCITYLIYIFIFLKYNVKKLIISNVEPKPKPSDVIEL